MNKNLSKQLYFSFIHRYINYAKITWGSTYHSKLKILYHHQKHAVRVINFKHKFSHAKPLLREVNILSVYETNISQTVTFMFNCKTVITPSVFSDIYRPESTDKHPLRSIGILLWKNIF